MYGSISRYRQNEIVQASPGELLLKLFDAADKNTRLAIEAVRNNRPAEKGVAVGKALSIIGELSAVFDVEKAPEIGQNVRALYQFVQDKLLEGSGKLDVEPLEEAARVIERLRATWAEAVEHARKEGVAV